MGQDRYDCIVAGAGPAGSAAALTMAQENMSVLLLERGRYPGVKKLFAGTIHRSAMDEIIPGFWLEAPVERPVVSDELWLLEHPSAVKSGFTGLNYGQPPYNKPDNCSYFKPDGRGGLESLPASGPFKNHPLIQRLLKGAETLEYGCHTVPKGGFTAIPKLYDHGVMVAGDAAGFVSGRRGADLAMLSGKYAGETAAQARARGDYSAQVLKAYENKLIHSFFYQDMKEAREGVKYFTKYQDSDYLINKTANKLAYEFFRTGLETKPADMGLNMAAHLLAYRFIRRDL